MSTKVTTIKVRTRDTDPSALTARIDKCLEVADNMPKEEKQALISAQHMIAQLANALSTQRIKIAQLEAAADKYQAKYLNERAKRTELAARLVEEQEQLHQLRMLHDPEYRSNILLENG